MAPFWINSARKLQSRVLSFMFITRELKNYYSRLNNMFITVSVIRYYFHLINCFRNEMADMRKKYHYFSSSNDWNVYREMKSLFFPNKMHGKTLSSVRWQFQKIKLNS